MSYTIISVIECEGKSKKTVITELSDGNKMILKEDNIVISSCNGIIGIFPKTSIAFKSEEKY